MCTRLVRNIKKVQIKIYQGEWVLLSTNMNLFKHDLYSVSTVWGLAVVL